MWLLLLLLSGAAAHVPTDTCDVGQTDVKSWAAYIEVDGRHECDVDATGKIALSVSVPFDEDPGQVHVSYRGVNCTNTGRATYYEPFGVGAYRLVKGCEGVVTGDVHVIMETNVSVPVSVGVGEAESFTPGELFTMPIRIATIWYWEGDNMWFVPGVVLLACRYLIFVYLNRKKFRSVSSVMALNLKGLPYFAITMVWFSCITFAYRILYLAEYWDGAVALSVILHVLVPFLLSLCIGLACGMVDIIGKILLASYFAFFLWMGWWVPTFFLLLDACVKLCAKKCRPCEVSIAKGTIENRVWTESI